MPIEPVRQTVILAAGAGTRLGPASVGDPKPLVAVGGVPLIGHALRHAHASGCTEAIVVIERPPEEPSERSLRLRVAGPRRRR